MLGVVVELLDNIGRNFHAQAGQCAKNIIQFSIRDYILPSLPMRERGLKHCKHNVSHAYFEDDLWILVQNRKYRKLLMGFIVEKKIKVVVGQDEKGYMAAEGRWLKNLLMMLAI